MAVPGIILLWENAILRETIIALLEEKGIGILADFDQRVSLDQISDIPATHILVEAGSKKFRRLLAELLQKEGIMVVQISLDNNKLQIFHRQDINVMEPSDLVHLLQHPARNS